LEIENKIKMYKPITKLVLGLAFFSIFLASGQEPLAKKETEFKGVYDYANMFSVQETQTLSRKLIQYADSTSTQIAVATIKSLNGYDISMLATEKAHEWGIGQNGKDNGVFVLIAQQDRKIKIATGYGVEHLLTDYMSKQVIDNIITPNFKASQYYKGVNQGVDAIIKVLAGEYKADPKKKKSSGKGNLIIIILIISFVIFLMSRGKDNNGGDNNSNRGRKRGLDASDVLTSMILGSLGNGRGYRGGSSSGGFGGGFSGGGFGGGGFGGGGASGGW